MKHNRLWKVAVATSLEAEDAVAELLSRTFEASPTVYADAETGRRAVAVYCETRPPGLARKVDAVRTGLKRIRSCGLHVGAGKVTTQQVRRQDWAESWKRHFKPITLGRTLLIKPSWSRRKPLRGQGVVVLDPGLSFGTGQHPTTSFCLRELVRLRKAGEIQSFLDVGTGSGILALAAARLGYSPVHAMDFDPDAVRTARANARVNRMAGKVCIARRDLTRLPVRTARRYDLICANLVSTLLIAHRNRLTRRLSRRGTLVLAGILRSEFKQVRDALALEGLRMVASHVTNEWRSGSFRRS